MSRYDILVRKVWDFAADNNIEFDHLADYVVARQAAHDYLTQAGVRGFIETRDVEYIGTRLSREAKKHGARGVVVEKAVK